MGVSVNCGGVRVRSNGAGVGVGVNSGKTGVDAGNGQSFSQGVGVGVRSLLHEIHYQQIPRAVGERIHRNPIRERLASNIS